MMDANSTTVSSIHSAMPAFQMVGKQAAVEKFAIMLIGPCSITEILKNEIHGVFHEQGSGADALSIHCCELLEDILQSSQSCHADFIVIILDSSGSASAEWVERSLCVLEPVYLCSRICLVNSITSSISNMTVDAEQIYNLVERFSVPLMNSRIQNKEERKNLAHRIHYLASSVCGIKTGYPLVFELPSTKIVT